MTLRIVEADLSSYSNVNTMCLIMRGEKLSEWLLAQVMSSIRTRFRVLRQ